ncbi:MAG TPA: SDR family oxidoreductase [Chryseosolibacter sp.]
MNLDLQGKKAMVCGSTQGIGKASAIELALLGAEITLVARNTEKLESVRKELPALHGQRHNFLVADFSDLASLESALSGFGDANSIHILVNNTGGPPAGQAIDAEIKDFMAAFTSHLACNHLLAKTLVPGMKAARYGRIINVISTSVKIPIRGLGVSNTIRGAVANWSKTLSLELAAYGITVNNVLPGASMTARLESIIATRAEKTKKSKEEIIKEMESEIPVGRISDPAEVAAAIAFLATPAAGYINGVNIPVDGGRTGSL